MPLPLIPLAVVAGLAVFGSGAGLAIRRMVGAQTYKQVAILGAESVGKSSLLHFFRDGRMPPSASATVSPTHGAKFMMDIDGVSVGFETRRDLPGSDGLGYPSWKLAIKGADYVWYMFRADLIAISDRETLEIVERHMALLVDWLATVRRNPPKVVLVGTHVDLLPESAQEIRWLKAAVSSSPPIKSGVVKLGDAVLALGSLSSGADASLLKRAVACQL